jgi:hypothetical protein
VKDDLAWEQYADLAAQLHYVGDLLEGYDAPTLQALTGYSALIDAINALCV